MKPGRTSIRHATFANRCRIPIASSPEGLRSRAVSANKLGDLLLRSGQLEEARASFQRGLSLALLDQDPDPQRHRFDLRISYSRLGDVALAGFDLDAAERAYRKALSYAEEQIAADPGDVKAQARGSGVPFEARAACALRRGDCAGALEYYRKYLAGCESLAAMNPNSAEARRELMVARSLVADAFFSKPDYAAAAGAYQQALDLAESLSREDSRSLQKRTDVYVLIAKLADIDERCERFEQAVRRIEQLRESLRDSARAGLITAAARDSLDAHHAVEKSACENGRGSDRPACDD